MRRDLRDNIPIFQLNFDNLLDTQLSLKVDYPWTLQKSYDFRDDTRNLDDK